MGNSWSNWSGSVKTQPATIAYPASEAEVQELIRTAGKEGKKIRIVGAGHSFTPLAATNQILVSLDKMSGIIEVDKKQKLATVWAGTRLKTLGELLYGLGLGMENLGDVDVQSIAGALSTGTHGTGKDFGTLATQIAGMTLVTASGEILHLTPDETPDLFKAAQISLGMLGIITRMTLKCVPAYKVRYTSSAAPMEAVLENIDQYLSNHRNFEFYYFPYTKTIQTKIMDLSEDKPSKRGIGTWFNDFFMENALFGLISRISRHFRAHKAMSKLTAWGVPKHSVVSWNHQAYATMRLVKFHEMEYNIPAEHFDAAFRELERNIRELELRVHFPIECRWVKADDIWLSPAYQRESAYIAVHMYKGMPIEPYFGVMEGILKKYNGRPHWGKMHQLTQADLRERYPKFDDFQAIRRKLDPGGMFLNGYLEGLFGGEMSDESNEVRRMEKVMTK